MRCTAAAMERSGKKMRGGLELRHALAQVQSIEKLVLEHILPNI